MADVHLCVRLALMVGLGFLIVIGCTSIMHSRSAYAAQHTLFSFLGTANDNYAGAKCNCLALLQDARVSVPYYIVSSAHHDNQIGDGITFGPNSMRAYAFRTHKNTRWIVLITECIAK